MSSETPNILTAGEAAKLVGKSVPTITRAIKSGKLSAEKREPKGWNIDASELFRVFPAISNETDQKVEMLEYETRNEDSMLQVEVKMLREQIQRMDATADREREFLTDQIEKMREDHRKALTVIEDMRPSEPPRQGLWARIRGR